jgi:arylsulfatase A-like enzyme
VSTRAALSAAALLLLAACGHESAPGPAAAGARYDAEGRLVGTPTPAARQRPNLVLLVLDTVRADAVGFPGGPQGVMPAVERLARGGVRLRDASAAAPWTVPSMASLLTGLLPSDHGCDGPGDPPHLVGAVTTFAEVLHASYGYQTAAYVAGPWFGAHDSLLQGFERVRTGFALRGAGRLLEPFVRGRDPKRPFFLLLHTFEAHDPYGRGNHPWPPREATPSPLPAGALAEPWARTRAFLLDRRARRALREREGPALQQEVGRYMASGYRAHPRPELAAELRRAYEDGLRWVDGMVGATVERLEASGLLENTVLVVTSDHGEAFGEHGTLGHGRSLYDELLRVPLVLKGPPPFDGGRVVAGGVGLVDVLPTFLDFAGCVPVPGLPGRSFLPLLRGEGGGRAVRAQARRERANTGQDVSVLASSVRSPRWKYVLTFDRLRGTVLESAYDLRADPGERQDLCAATGRADALAFGPAFCAAVEEARDRLWGAAERGDRLADTPYGGGSARVTSKRPAPCR